MVEKPVEITSKPDEIQKENRADKPIKREITSSFNLKNLFDKVEEEKPETPVESSGPTDDFSKGKFEEVWMEFLGKLQNENKIPAYNALLTATHKLGENQRIYFTFNSASLLKEFDLQKENLMLFLREKLNNHLIEFQTEILEDESKNFVKSKAEIFKEMAEKNPILLKMKEDLGLDYNSSE